MRLIPSRARKVRASSPAQSLFKRTNDEYLTVLLDSRCAEQALPQSQVACFSFVVWADRRYLLNAMRKALPKKVVAHLAYRIAHCPVVPVHLAGNT